MGVTGKGGRRNQVSCVVFVCAGKKGHTICSWAACKGEKAANWGAIHTLRRDHTNNWKSRGEAKLKKLRDY